MFDFAVDSVWLTQANRVQLHYRLAVSRSLVLQKMCQQRLELRQAVYQQALLYIKSTCNSVSKREAVQSAQGGMRQPLCEELRKRRRSI